MIPATDAMGRAIDRLGHYPELYQLDARLRQAKLFIENPDLNQRSLNIEELKELIDDLEALLHHASLHNSFYLENVDNITERASTAAHLIIQLKKIAMREIAESEGPEPLSSYIGICEFCHWALKLVCRGRDGDYKLFCLCFAMTVT